MNVNRETISMGGYYASNPLTLDGLMRAIENEDPHFLHELSRSQQKLDLRATVNEGCPPLHYAVKKASAEFLAVLLRHIDLCPEITGSSEFVNSTVMNLAVERQDVDIVRLLINAGLDINQLCVRSHLTPLITATANTYYEIVALLIDAGADASTVGRHGHTALERAVLNDDSRLIELIVNHDPSVHAPHGAAKLLNLAIKHDCFESLHALIAQGLNCSDVLPLTNATLLMNLAYYEDSVGVAQVLLDNGVPVNAKDRRGYTAFMYAAEQNNIELLRLLSTRPGINLEERSCHQLNTFGCASPEECREVISEFWVMEPLRGLNWFSETALMAAVRTNSLEAVRELIRLGANVNAHNDQGDALLILAAKYASGDVMAELCAHGANMQALEHQGWNALSVAMQHENVEGVAALIAAGADVNQKVHHHQRLTALMVAVLNNCHQALPMLVNAGVDINTQNAAGDTALAMAVQDNSVNFVQHLLALGANPNAGYSSRNRPLQHAMQVNNPAITALLMQAGAMIISAVGMPRAYAPGAHPPVL
jgi:ankyrin repeat protein